MKSWEFILRDYMIGRPVIAIQYDEDDPTVGEIVDLNRELPYGQIEVTEDGKLASLLIEMEDIMEHNDVSLDEYEELTQEDLMGIAEDFIDEFYQKELTFRSISEWNGESYLLTFEAKDVALNLFLPNSGVTLEINKQGFILSATFNQSYYQLAYPDIQISAEDAKEILFEQPLVELAITDLNGELQLLYKPKSGTFRVHVDGSLQYEEDFMEYGEQNANSFEPVTVTESVKTLLGVTDDMQLIEDGANRFWYIGNSKNTDEEEPVIKIENIDSMFMEYESLVEWEEQKEELPEATLANKAKMFLEAIVGDVHEKYLLEVQQGEMEYSSYGIITEEDLSEEERQFFEELELEEDDEFDENFDFEPYTTFSFIRQHKGVLLSDYTIHINVGKYTGIIRECSLLLPNEGKLNTLDIVPVLPLEEADAKFKEQLEMHLARTEVNDEEDEDLIIYDLTYEAEFPAGKEIMAINAMSGEVYYAEEEYEED
mgnify:CR=1 FL=1